MIHAVLALRNNDLELGNILIYKTGMTRDDLEEVMARLSISKPEMAGLLGVTVRGLNLWLSSDREIPGPVEAYVRLLSNVPATLVSQELARLKKGDPNMFEGMYLIAFEGAAGPGTGVLVLQGGTIYGHDGGVSYDGDYRPTPATPGCLDLNLRVTVPAGVALVTGLPSQPAGHWFDIRCTIVMRSEGAQRVDTPYGSVNVRLKYLRDIPGRRAA